MDGVQLSQGYRATTKAKFTFYTTKFPGVSGAHFIHLGRMKV